MVVPVADPDEGSGGRKMRTFEPSGRLAKTPPYNPPQAVTRMGADPPHTSHRPTTIRSRLVSPMRELERELPTPLSDALGDRPLAIVGRGRVGGSLARAAEAAGIEVRLAGREDSVEVSAGARAVLLCVPDAAIGEAREAIASAAPPLLGHVSGATGLDALWDAGEPGPSGFSIHPLQTFADDATPVEGTPCAVAGSDERALRFASSLAETLGMRPFKLPEQQRAAYHAAASIASNFLVALEESAAELLERAGVADARELLAPLVLRTAANWAAGGPEALTGPIARGDRETVERHRAAIAELAPDLLPTYEALAERAAAVASKEVTA
jgi:predicted short-subunit dehydrogenase-like oxidoreductase (DUF2520 family)